MYKHLDNGTIFLPLYTSPVNIRSNGCNVTNADFNLKVLTKVLTDFEFYVAPLLNSFQNN